MFRYEKQQKMHCASHVWNMIILSMIKTTSRGSFNHDLAKRIQNGGWMRKGGECPKEPKLELSNVQFKYGPMKKYNGNYRQCAESRIFGRTLPQNVIKTVTSTIKLLSLSKTRPQNSRISANPSDAGSIWTKGLERVYKRRGKLGRDAKPTGVWGSCASHKRI